MKMPGCMGTSTLEIVPFRLKKGLSERKVLRHGSTVLFLLSREKLAI